MHTTAQELDGAESPASTEPDLETHLTSEEADAIFRQAEAEIQTILRKMRRERFVGWIQGVLCVSLLLFSLGGIVWQCITYPHTLIVLYAKATPASITATLDIPTRPLAPVTITRSATTATSGTGHRDARPATGTVTLYNGQLQRITVSRGTVFTGRDGKRITLTQEAVIPAADPTTTPPTYGQVNVAAQAVHPGARGNIPAFDVSGSCCAASVIVKNLAAFTNGQDARDYPDVAPQDLHILSLMANEVVTQALTTAFPLRPGEEAIPTQCHTTTTANHAVGDEATSVTVTAVKTCLAVAYNRQQLTRQATAAFIKTRPGVRYHLIGSVQTIAQGVTPLSVTISGTWTYTFSPDYQQFLAEHIAGDSPAKARASLLKTGVISYASIPGTLPPDAMYISFLVLVC